MRENEYQGHKRRFLSPVDPSYNAIIILPLVIRLSIIMCCFLVSNSFSYETSNRKWQSTPKVSVLLHHNMNCCFFILFSIVMCPTLLLNNKKGGEGLGSCHEKYIIKHTNLRGKDFLSHSFIIVLFRVCFAWICHSLFIESHDFSPSSSSSSSSFSSFFLPRVCNSSSVQYHLFFYSVEEHPLFSFSFILLDSFREFQSHPFSPIRYLYACTLIQWVVSSVYKTRM